MTLMSLQDACLSFGDVPLLDNVEVHIEENERVCLAGRNGAGKSTLMRVFSGEQTLDNGRVLVSPDLVVGRLQQDPPREFVGTVYDFIAEGAQGQAEYLKAWHAISQDMIKNPSEKNLAEMARLQTVLDHRNLWHLESDIHAIIEQMGLSAETALTSLSGGWLRKAALGRALVTHPSLLLLDEPTNHLDIETIQWLENFLKNFRASIVFVSHDRAFIQSMATRILDLDRGKLTSWPGNYQNYLEGKEEALRVEEMQNAEFDRKLAQEEVWIRQGIKARRTRNEGRVRALKSLRRERSERHNVLGRVKMQVEEASRSGKIVFELENVSYCIEGNTLVDHFSAQVLRGDKIALVGPNGCGKTTLLKLLLGELNQTTGRIYRGTKLEIATFDQHRAVLDPQLTVLDNLAHGRQEVTVNGKTRHALGYLQDFLFHPKRARTPVYALSGGEKNRLLLARLFLKPSNLLLLDEPTNDLDVETLELLEERVSAYTGTVLLVSHDREFVDNTVTECWMFEGKGKIDIFPGGYQDAQQQRAAYQAHQRAQEKTPFKELTKNTSLKREKARPVSTEEAPPIISKPNSKKLTYNEQRELDSLPRQLEMLETQLKKLQAKISEPGFFEQPREDTAKVLNTLAQTEKTIEEAFARWEQLEALKT